MTIRFYYFLFECELVCPSCMVMYSECDPPWTARFVLLKFQQSMLWVQSLCTGKNKKSLFPSSPRNTRRPEPADKLFRRNKLSYLFVHVVYSLTSTRHHYWRVFDRQCIQKRNNTWHDRITWTHKLTLEKEIIKAYCLGEDEIFLRIFSSA